MTSLAAAPSTTPERVSGLAKVTRDIRHGDGWEIKAMPLRVYTLRSALRGDMESRKRICMAFRDRIKHETGHDPGKINFSDLEFR